MKLIRLDLLRYGHLSDVALEFPEDAALHVVHGANEAGKSTALAAIADALFGFSHRTEFDFLHGAPQLRVGFTLLARDGTVGAFIRRKGRRDTLRDADDQSVPEDALLHFLGGASRELFERGFGLDGVRLRQGGQAIAPQWRRRRRKSVGGRWPAQFACRRFPPGGGGEVAGRRWPRATPSVGVGRDLAPGSARGGGACRCAARLAGRIDRAHRGRE